MMSQEDEKLMERLKQNDPAITLVEIYPMDIDMATRMGEALQGNTSVCSLCIGQLYDIRLPKNEESLRPLLRYIRTSQQLKTFEMICISDYPILELFLNAVSESSSVVNVALSCTTPSTTSSSSQMPFKILSNLISCSRTIQSLKMEGLQFENFDESTNNERLIAEAESLLIQSFRKNQTLRRLAHSRCGNLPSFFTTAILASISIEEVDADCRDLSMSDLTELLTSSTSFIKKIILRHFYRQNVSEEELLMHFNPDAFQNNVSLEELELFRVDNASMFRLLLLGVMNTPNLRTLKIGSWKLEDTTAVELLIQLVCKTNTTTTLRNNNTKIEVLCFENYHGLHALRLTNAVQQIIAAKSFQLREIQFQDTSIDISQILALFHNGHTFDCLRFGNDVNRRQFQDLVDCIPKLRGLQRIGIGMQKVIQDKQSDILRKRLIEAMRVNYCLQEFCFTNRLDDQTVQDQKVIQKFCDRNRFVQEWTHNNWFNKSSNVCDYVLAAACFYDNRHEVLFRSIQGCWAPNNTHVKYDIGGCCESILKS